MKDDDHRKTAHIFNNRAFNVHDTFRDQRKKKGILWAVFWKRWNKLVHLMWGGSYSNNPHLKGAQINESHSFLCLCSYQLRVSLHFDTFKTLGAFSPGSFGPSWTQQLHSEAGKQASRIDSKRWSWLCSSETLEKFVCSENTISAAAGTKSCLTHH